MSISLGVVSGERANIDHRVLCRGRPVCVSESPVIVVSHVNIELLSWWVTNNFPNWGALTHTHDTRGSGRTIVPVVVVYRVGRVESHWRVTAEVLGTNSLCTNVRVECVAGCVVATVWGWAVGWCCVAIVVNSGVKVVLGVSWLILTRGVSCATCLAQAILFEGLHVLAQEGHLELSVKLESKLTTDGTLVLIEVSVNKDLLRSTVKKSEWVVQFRKLSRANVSIVQGVRVRELELVGSDEGSKVIVDVVLEHGEDHATNHDLA